MIKEQSPDDDGEPSTPRDPREARSLSDLNVGDVPKGEMPPTRWTRIRALGSGNDQMSQEAADWFARNYWLPVCNHLRRKGISEPDAQDITQGFFNHLLTRKRAILAALQSGSVPFR